MSSTPAIAIRDHDDLLELTFADVEKYHGQWAIGGAALGFQVLRAGLQALFPDAPPRRDEISIVTGHPGPGFRDAFELVTRAVTRRAYLVDKSRPDGRYNPFNDHAYSWSVARADGLSAEIVLREDLIPFRFFELWDRLGRDVATAEDRLELNTVKRQVADDVLARSLEELFTVTLREPLAQRGAV